MHCLVHHGLCGHQLALTLGRPVNSGVRLRVRVFWTRVCSPHFLSLSIACLISTCLFQGLKALMRADAADLAHARDALADAGGGGAAGAGEPAPATSPDQAGPAAANTPAWALGTRVAQLKGACPCSTMLHRQCLGSKAEPACFCVAAASVHTVMHTARSKADHVVAHNRYLRFSFQISLYILPELNLNLPRCAAGGTGSGSRKSSLRGRGRSRAPSTRGTGTGTGGRKRRGGGRGTKRGAGADSGDDSGDEAAAEAPAGGEDTGWVRRSSRASMPKRRLSMESSADEGAE